MMSPSTEPSADWMTSPSSAATSTQRYRAVRWSGGTLARRCSRTILFQTSVLSLASGESTKPESAAKRVERTPGWPPEGVYLKAGVIGEDELTWGETGIVDGLERSVSQEGVAIFFRGGDVVGRGQGINEDGVCVGSGAEVAKFALAGGGGEKAESHGESVTAVRVWDSGGKCN